MPSQNLPIVLNLVAAFFGALGQYFYKLGGQKLGTVPLYKNYPLIGGILMFCAVMGLFVAAYKAALMMAGLIILALQTNSVTGGQ